MGEVVASQMGGNPRPPLGSLIDAFPIGPLAEGVQRRSCLPPG